MMMSKISMEIESYCHERAVKSSHSQVSLVQNTLELSTWFLREYLPRVMRKVLATWHNWTPEIQCHWNMSSSKSSVHRYWRRHDELDRGVGSGNGYINSCGDSEGHRRIATLGGLSSGENHCIVASVELSLMAEEGGVDGCKSETGQQASRTSWAWC